MLGFVVIVMHALMHQATDMAENDQGYEGACQLIVYNGHLRQKVIRSYANWLNFKFKLGALTTNAMRL